MYIWPHEESHCLEIPSTETKLGPNIGHILDGISFSTHPLKSEQR